MNKSQYEHFPLESRSIRIIVLEPASDPSSEIKCSLYKTSLDYVVNFEALSYSWDGQSPDQPINCRTVGNLDDDPNILYDTLSVTVNCLHALRALREQSNRRLLWIDGICINQADIDEKSVQVALMGELYAASRGVIVWLGNEDEAAARAFKFVLEIGAPMEEIIKWHKDGLVRRFDNCTVEDERSESLKEIIRNLGHMSKVQEVVLPAVSTIIVQCGSLQVWLPTLLFVIKRIESAGFTKSGIQASMRLQLTLIDELSKRRFAAFEKDDQGALLEQGFSDLSMTNFSHLLKVYNQEDEDLKSNIKLSAILDGARSKQATEAVDKVYALYGVLQELGMSISPPNYRKPAEDVFLEVAHASISTEKTLEVLYLATTETRRSSLPSWVPDLTDRGFGNMDPRNCANDSKRFAAGNLLSPLWTFVRPHCLRVRTKLVAEVAKTFTCFDVYVDSLPDHDDNLPRIPPSEESRGEYHKAFLVVREWAKAVQTVAANFPSRKNMIMSFLKVLLHDEESCIAYAEEDDHFESWFSVLEKDDLELLRWMIITKEKKKSLAKLAKVAEYKGPSVLKQLKSWKTQMSTALEEREVSSKSFAADVFGRTEMHNVTLPAMEPVLPLHLAALRYARRQAFFTTETGRFGNAPDRIAASAVRQGDRIAVIAGLSLPFVLRPVKMAGTRKDSGEYKLISHCYLDGIMHGEAIHEGDAELQDIVLV
ncbi:hypothetical protein E8E14_003971 [Neopestalotiopsis sp. 37M]|nr:hypothetical protein E8E14_003971 [Neopestalotiopsis sp. 37M]